MEIQKTVNYDEMSEIACNKLLTCLIKKPNALFCIATGSSPTGTYKKFIEKIKKEKIDVSQIKIIKLDEWCGIEKSNPSTCESYIQEHIIRPLAVSGDRYISFDPLAVNAVSECDRIKNLIKLNNGIDMCVLGLGKNGHIGLNEPCDETYPFIHKASLAETTKNHNLLTKNGTIVSTGFTLGIKEIFDAKEILLLITGDGKESAKKKFLEKKVSPKCPASYLWLHNNTTCLIEDND